ncbi:hypothetical protein HDU92_006127, partial [Lobulomyces angularis]
MFCPLELVLTGDFNELLEEDNTVVMSNHLIYSDWWYIWILSWVSGKHGNIRIILKNSLKYLPFFGWAMSYFEFIFLTRKWVADKANLTENLSKCKSNNLPIWLVIFPEGTVICDETIPSSTKYLKKMNWVEKYPLSNVLLPKHTGLFHSLDILKPKSLYDVTLSYSGVTEGKFAYDVYPLAKVFFKGEGPKRVYLNIKRHDLSSIRGFQSEVAEGGGSNVSERSEEFGDFLREQFLLKDLQLKNFYSHQDDSSNDIDEAIHNQQQKKIVKCTPKIKDFIFLGLILFTCYFTLNRILALLKISLSIKQTGGLFGTSILAILIMR